MADENTQGKEGGEAKPFEPVTLYDESGNEVKAVNMEKYNELTSKIEGLEKELTGLKDKEYNFSRFRAKTEAEKKEIVEGMTQKEKLLYEKIDNLESEREKEKIVRMTETAEVVLEQLAGTDAEMRKAIELQEREFIGEALTPQEKETRLRKAFTLVKGYKPKVNPLHAPLGSIYREPDLRDKKFGDTPEGKEFLKANFPKIFKDNK